MHVLTWTVWASVGAAGGWCGISGAAAATDAERYLLLGRGGAKRCPMVGEGGASATGGSGTGSDESLQSPCLHPHHGDFFSGRQPLYSGGPFCWAPQRSARPPRDPGESPESSPAHLRHRGDLLPQPQDSSEPLSWGQQWPSHHPRPLDSGEPLHWALQLSSHQSRNPRHRFVPDMLGRTRKMHSKHTAFASSILEPKRLRMFMSSLWQLLVTSAPPPLTESRVCRKCLLVPLATYHVRQK